MTEQKTESQKAADEVGADQVQEAFDKAAEQGYFGYSPDETPRDNYTLRTPQDAPTPETKDRVEQAQAREEQRRQRGEDKAERKADRDTAKSERKAAKPAAE